MTTLRATSFLCLALLAAASSGVRDQDVQFVRVVDGQTRIPGQEGFFAEFSAPVISGERIAFYAHGLSLQQGIYLWRDGVLSIVADNDTSIPRGRGQFSSFSPPTMDQGAIAFHGSGLSGQSGIYLWHDDVIDRVVDLTDRLDEKTPITLELRPGGLSGHSVAFLASFSDGAEAIYLATIP